ncbi:facilitated trehalose transporter Tret1-like [Schistocerca piceifrons]|uniref:facilitated trehalose transporter Tret1-like n=1 Tax=Schistocerca piceifrons TaxID=274613 RepID=UPI001F5F7FC1|nr:facilitated trehalose transporter Tret1-like [Schistocerca piceifrons]
MSVLRQFAATVIVDVSCCMLFGVVAGWTSSALPLLQSDASPLGVPLTVEEGSWVGAVSTLTGTVGTPLFGLCVARYGCKPSAFLAAALMLGSWVLILVGQHVAVLIVSRALAGVSGAGGFVVCGAYVRDISEDAVRGSLCSFLVIAYIIGLLCSYALPLALSYTMTAVVSLVLSAASLAGLFWLPDTPWYYFSKGRPDEAKASLRWFRVGKTEEELETEFAMRQAAVEKKRLEDAERHVSLRDLFATKANRRAFAIGMVVCANQQLSGIIAVVSYAEGIFSAAGGAIDPALSAVVVGASLLGGVAVSTLLTDRAGRRALLLLSNAGIAVSTAALGAHFYVTRAGGWSPGWLPIASLCVFVVTVSLGVYPVPYVVLAEIFSQRIRELATSLGLTLLWGVCFLVAKLYPSVAAAWGDHVCYWFFCASCVACGLFIALVMPETKGRSLEDIQNDLAAGRLCGRRAKTEEAIFSSSRWLTLSGQNLSVNNQKKEIVW